MSRPLNLSDKPSGCAACQYSSISSGFCPDWVPPNPKLAFLAEAAGAEEIIDREPLSGGTGKIFNKILQRVGLSRHDCAIFNTIRCKPPGNVYPVGDLRQVAEISCRQYDGGLQAYNPDHFLVTIHPAAAMRSWSLIPVIEKDFQKAVRLMEGRRLLVLLGDKATTLKLLGIQIGVSKFRGSWGRL